MRQLLPEPMDDVDLFEVYRPGSEDHVRINMVSSVDGAVIDASGRSGSIGGTGDRELFRTLRALADAIVVGAGTVRAEGYGPHRLLDRLARRRAAGGRPDPASIVVVSASLALDLEAPLFSEAVARTIVVTTARADSGRRSAAQRVATVLEAGEEVIDPVAAVQALRDLGHHRLLVEGGPRLNALLLAAGVVDEVCLTLGPSLLDGDGPRLAAGLPTRVDLGLLGVLTDGDELYLRYATGRSEPGAR